MRFNAAFLLAAVLAAATPACATTGSGGAAVKSCGKDAVATAKADVNEVVASDSYVAEIDKIVGTLGACAVQAGVDQLITDLENKIAVRASADPLANTKLEHLRAWKATPKTSASSRGTYHQAAYAEAETNNQDREIAMGNWNITIRGTGAHHNKGNDSDANKMAARFVEELKDEGHTIISATITVGSEDDVTDPEKYLEAANQRDNA